MTIFVSYSIIVVICATIYLRAIINDPETSKEFEYNIGLALFASIILGIFWPFVIIWKLLDKFCPRNCKSCKTTNPQKAIFCKHCGTKLG